MTLLNEYACVSELIDSVNHSWNQELINQIFSPLEFKAISTIPLSLVDKEDKMVWIFSKNTIFSIKSAYHYHHSASIQTKCESSFNRAP